jgi:hypothetical protein
MKALVVASALAVLSAVVVPTASAAGERTSCFYGTVVVDVTQRVYDDVDAGLAGNAWASKMYNRRIVVRQTGWRTFCAYSTAGGYFTTLAGESPGTTGWLNAGISGTVMSQWRSTSFNATFLPLAATSGALPPIDFQCKATFFCPGYADWRQLYFRDVVGYDVWQWDWGFNGGTYGSWQHRSIGTSGDITSPDLVG